jgi:hypothetical protein
LFLLGFRGRQGLAGDDIRFGRQAMHAFGLNMERAGLVDFRQMFGELAHRSGEAMHSVP